MHCNPWTPALSALGVALLVSACTADPTTSEEESASVDGETPPSDAATSSNAEEQTEGQDGAAQADDIYADPLPPGREDPPIYDYQAVPTPEAPFDHAPLEQAFADALEDGATSDDSGLIELEQPVKELTVNGETFTVDGVIDPGSAEPLYEDQLTQDGVGPLAEELTGVPWHGRRQHILEGNAPAVSCGEDTESLWVAFDTDKDPTCFEEPGGVTDPYFRGISAVCTAESSPSTRTLYMGFGGEHSFAAEWGDRTGWDMMYQGPDVEGDNSCYAFTLPVRGATTETSGSALSE
ncbi:hypothetical protein [Nesterenkonia populi]|uniref:hypothetical protein n=1 Tax=Nesterenkonia populi TaxID=1591087 RepID=UPI0011BEA474|nr:hypothetical protein [Nesterenkonia populi]